MGKRALLATLLAVVVAGVSVVVATTGGGGSDDNGSSAVGRSASCAPPGDSWVSLRSSGEDRRAWVHVPEAVAGRSPAPVVLMFHGYTSALSPHFAEMDRLGKLYEPWVHLIAKSNAEGFVLVYPRAQPNMSGDYEWRVPSLQAVDDAGGAQRDVDFVRALVAQLIRTHCVDGRRVYATGLSNGGGMADRLGCEAADLFSAIAPVAGMYLGKLPCRPSRPIPVVAFHGVADEILPYRGGNVSGDPGQPAVIPVARWAAAWARRNGCGAQPVAKARIGKVQPLFWPGCSAAVRLYRIEDGQHAWPGAPVVDGQNASQDVSATDLIWRFFAEHSGT
jgi:polyhydroxybutyrate depolymerase